MEYMAHNVGFRDGIAYEISLCTKIASLTMKHNDSKASQKLYHNLYCVFPWKWVHGWMGIHPSHYIINVKIHSNSNPGR